MQAFLSPYISDFLSGEYLLDRLVQTPGPAKAHVYQQKDTCVFTSTAQASLKNVTVVARLEPDTKHAASGREVRIV